MSEALAITDDAAQFNDPEFTRAVLDIAPQLAFSDVRFETRPAHGADYDWIGLTCRQLPKGVWYRVGARHQYLMGRNGKKWAVRRPGLLIRLLLKRLAREVAE